MFQLGLLTPLLLFVAFLLLLLISLSVPIIKTIFLFRLTAKASSSLLHSSAEAYVNFGAFGYCTSGLDATILGIDRNTAGECTRAHAGYTFDDTVAKALHVSGFENLISKGLTAVLVMHPIVASLTFVTFLMSLFMLRRGSNGTSRFPSLLTLGIGIFTAFLTTIVFLIDVILVAVVRKRVNNDTDGVITLNWGNAVWMALAATVLLWISMVGSCIGLCGGNKRHKDAEKY
ncbi:pali-domain-containing protein [Mycena rebaudengoi]|nr:pali-domain-containing protein [Mycena rebaudengoi]